MDTNLLGVSDGSPLGLAVTCEYVLPGPGASYEEEDIFKVEMMIIVLFR